MAPTSRSIRPHYKLNAWKESMAFETQILIAKDLGYVGPADDLLESADRVSRLLAGLHKKDVSGCENELSIDLTRPGRLPRVCRSKALHPA